MKEQRVLAFTLSLFSQFPIASTPLGLTDTSHSSQPADLVSLPTEEFREIDSLEISSYLIGPGDILELILFDVPELSGPVTVLSDGSVSIPLVGNVMMNGLTLQQAAEKAQKLLTKELLRPQLQLRVIEARPIRVSVVGAVERPGLYSLSNRELSQTEGAPVTTSTGPPTVVDAIVKAGGITPQANLRSVRLQRRLPGIPKRFKLTQLNLLELLLEGDQQHNPILFDGDTIKLDRAQETQSDAIELVSSNLSPRVIEVNVIGEVNNPGLLRLRANTPLVQAILAAGGLKDWRANVGNVELVRINSNGSATLRRLRFNIGSDASNETNPPLRSGDTVRVNPSFLAKGSDAVKVFSEPVGGLVTIWTLFRLIQPIQPAN